MTEIISDHLIPRDRKSILILPGVFKKPLTPTVPATATELEPEMLLPEDAGYKDRDWQLICALPEMVAGMDLASVAVPMPGRALPRSIGNFSLASATPNVEVLAKTEKPRSSIRELAGRYKIDPPVPGHSPHMFLDASMGICLLYKGDLTAVAAAGLAESGRLRIIQVQGLRRNSDNGKPNYKDNGLHAGVWWDNTLVRAWIKVARQSSIAEVELQSAQNSEYFGAYDQFEDDAPKVDQALIERYNRLAINMGFRFDQPTGNYVTSSNLPY